MKKITTTKQPAVIQAGNTSIWNIFFWVLAIIPVVRLFTLINTYSLNMPNNDDWDAILGFLNTWKHSDHKLVLLFHQHNEHRILASNIIYAAYYSLFHNINFLSIIYIANIQLLVITAIIIYFIKKVLNIPTYYGLLAFIVSLCIFDASSYDNSNFAMAGLQNYGVIMLFLLSLFFYSITPKSSIAFIPAVVFQFLCTFSSGNGFIAGIAILFYTILNKEKSTIIVCTIGVIIFTAFYFLFYHSVTNDGDIKAKSVLMLISFFLKTSGAHFSFEKGIMMGILLYAVFFGALFYKVRHIELKRILPFLSLFLFATISLGAIALFRSGQKGIFENHLYSSRYLIYPQLLTIIVFVLLVYRIHHFKYVAVTIGICSLLLVKAYQENYNLGVGAFEKRYNKFTMRGYVYPNQAYAGKIAIEACNNGIYCIDANRP